MKCSKCQFENPDGIKFCNECGQKLTLVCPACKAVNQPGSKFCGECGHNLSLHSEPTRKDLSFDEKIAKIQKYLPSGITEKILSQRDRIEGEKRQVTVMFCDMKGFTPLSEKLGPETMYAMMDEVYEILIHKVHDYEGTVNEMTGDGVMALFGAPIALEDAPQRAIRSAMAIHREMTRFNERMRQEKGDFPPVKMRIGIHTGPVVVGTLGNDLRVEFKAVGDTVNLASRMESLAEPGTTYISADTFRITEGLFRVEALGEREIKGKEKPLKVYQVIAPSSRRTRFDVSAERGLTPFVGRQRELELLLDGFERSREGRGQAISIISEAGIGKSRLLYEFRKAVTNEDVTFLEGRCLSYSRNAAYHPIVDILKANFDIQDGDTDQNIREKVTAGLKILTLDEPSTLPYLLDLLSVKESGIEKIQMSPEARKDRTLEALKRITLKGSEVRPLIMAVEDLHWMDRSSEDAFKQLLESISGSRVFLIFTYRPEFIHTWGSRSYHSQVTLNRLSNRESLLMLSHLLKTEDINRDLEELVLEKTEGIPFFIEEFIKSLKDLKIIECRNGSFRITRDMKTVVIPSTIHDVIMARVDALPEGARELLRTGSVIEREFNHALIWKITGLPEQELLSHLSTLRDAELLYERGIYPDATYIFRHALAREVVYDSILTRTKKQLHIKVADAIEELYGTNQPEHFTALADHYLAGEDCIKGVEYAKRAGRQAEKRNALNDAIAIAKKRILALEKAPKTDEIEKQRVDARVTLGLYYNQMTFPADAKEAIEPILETASRYANKRRLAQISQILGCHAHLVQGNHDEAIATLSNGLKVAEEANDFISMVMINHWLAHVYEEQCEFEKALACMQVSISLTELAKSNWGTAIMKSCTSSSVFGLLGKIGAAYRMGQEAVRMADDSGDIMAKAESYMHFGFDCYLMGLADEAEKYLIQGLDYCRKINFLGTGGFAALVLGMIQHDQGKHELAEMNIEEGMRMSELAQMNHWRNFADIVLTVIRAGMHENDVDTDALRGRIQRNGVRHFNGWLRRFLAGSIMNKSGRYVHEAEAILQSAIEEDTKNRTMWDLGKNHALYGEWFRQQGDIPKAREQLTKAIDIFRECEADGWVTKTEKALAEIS